MKIVENYIAPVVRLHEQADKIRFDRLHGTAFFVNSRGVFITAAHVIRNAVADVESHGGGVAISVRKPADSQNAYVGHIRAVSFAEEPYDIAVGCIAEPSQSCFVLGEDMRVLLWDDVYTAGFAESAVSRDGDSVRPDVRGLKGYMVRKVPPGEHLSLLGRHPAALEVSFSVPHCMSGSPLVLRYDPDVEPPADAPLQLLGVCVATASVKVGDGVEHYGVVHDLISLKDWKPDCLSGETLGEAIKLET